MLLESLRKQVLAANQEIARRGLAPHTFGNASGVDRCGDKALVVIKPSGVDYDTLRPQDLVITDLDGKIVEGDLRPSRVPPNWWCGSHALGVRDIVGAGLSADSLLRDDPCRLFSWFGSGDRTAYGGGGLVRVRTQYWGRDREKVPG
jgi:hypothetical protein